MGPEPPPRIPSELGGEDLPSAVLGPTEVATFENLYLAYRIDGLRLAQRLLGDSEHAADAVHAAFIEILRYLLSGRRWYDPGDARALVLRNVRWAALNIARARRRREEVTGARLAEDSAVGDDWARIEVRQLCEEIVRRLRPRDRDAIHLHFVEGLSHAEAASRLDTTAAAFQKQLARALHAARRGAHSVGATPGYAAIPGVLLRRFGTLKQRRRYAGRRVIRAMGTVATAAAVAAGVGTVLGGAGLGSGPSTIRSVTAASHTARPSGPPSAPVPRDGLDTSVVVDAVEVRTPAASLLLALGEGRRCECWLVFRSRDGGVSWDSMPGPSTMPPDPRLDLPRGSPADRRIFIVSSTPGGPLLAAAAFGAEFAPVGAPAPSWARVWRASENGNVLTTAADRYMYVDPDGNVFCSRPAHPDWRLACDSTAGA